MSGVYSVEDLLKLRASPLISKPPNLPPIEEWMGSQEPATKRPTTRGRQEDNHLQTEAFQKKPTLDPSLRKSTTDPERIVLGPPKRSFASSNARTFGKAGTVDAEDAQRDEISRHERTKTGEDLEHKFGDRRSGQYSGANGRYGTRHDQDHERPRRKHDEEDVESRSKRDHDRPKWAREEKGDEEVDDNGTIKPGFRRDPQTRSRFEQSWLRSDRGTEEARKDTERSGWRRDRAREGDLDMPGRGDADPEWMDSVDAAEPAQAHTQEDFQRWKERMKAAANGPAEDKPGPPATIVASSDGDLKQSQGFKPTGLGSPDLSANSMDKFFAKFTEKMVTADDKSAASRPATKSKFASLFSPPAETKPEPQLMPAVFAMSPSPVTAPAPTTKTSFPMSDLMGNSTDADQAGFKRILEMLGKRDATPTMDSPNPKPIAEQQSQERHQSPDLMALFKQTQPIRQTPTSQPPPGLERLIESRSPAEGHRRQQTPNKDELLLNLLRHADMSAKAPQQPQRESNEQRPPPGFFSAMNEPSRNESRPMHEDRQDMDRPVSAQQRGNSRPVFDDPAISGYLYQDDTGNRQESQRRTTNGFEDMYFDRLRQQEQKSVQPPPGMPRPPGFEQMPRTQPGWPSQAPIPPHLQPRAGQGPLPPHLQQRPGPGPGLPPGINMPRGMQPPYGGPQQGQRPPQRKYTGESSLPNFPPGFGPPPGFAPPPGFQSSNVPNQAQHHGRYPMGNEGPGPHQQGPPHMNRAFVDMYGEMERGGLRGGNGGVPLPPGFR